MFFRLFHVFCCQNFIETVFSTTKAHRSCVFYSGFKRAFLTSGVGEIWFENGLRESTRPCFAAAELSFLAGSLSCGGIEGSLFCCQNFIETVFQLGNHVFPAFSRVLLPKTSSKPCFQLGKLTEGVFFIVDLNAPFWHRGSEKCGSKMAFVNRPGHAVSLLRNCHFWLVLCLVGVSKVACSAAKTSSKLCFSYEIAPISPKLRLKNAVRNLPFGGLHCVFYSGFKRTFLTSGVGEMWFENGWGYWR